MWMAHSMRTGDKPLFLRSSCDISLLTISAIYIIRNKVLQYAIDLGQTQRQDQILPI
jgi:hypothetical protein